MGNSPAGPVTFPADKFVDTGDPLKIYSMPDEILSNAETRVCRSLENTDFEFHRNTSVMRKVESSEKLPSSKTKRNSQPSLRA